MWQPIANTGLSRRLWAALEDIEEGLRQYLRSEARQPPQDPALASGTAGVALFFAYLGAARQGANEEATDQNEDADSHALDALDLSLDALAETQLVPSLYSGFCGIGWVVEHLTRTFYEGAEDLNTEIDSALQQLLSSPAGIKPYELISGLCGFGTYLVERLPYPDAEELLVRILDHLEEAAQTSGNARTWLTFPEWIPEWQRPRYPQGMYNLGVAHGVPGVVGFLAAAHQAGLSDPRTPVLAESTVRWLLSQRLPDADSAFPALVVPGTEPEATRTAWCYGDPGIAAVLLLAARSFSRPDWEDQALALARLAAQRPVEDTDVTDACLCHGAAGLAHVFNRIHQATGDRAMKEAALAWLERTLEQRRPGQGIAGFQSWISQEDGGGSWRGEPGFLVGVAGIGLALLAAVTDVEPAWDRVMLLSMPSPPG